MRGRIIRILRAFACAAAFGGAAEAAQFRGESFKFHMQGMAEDSGKIYCSHTDKLAVIGAGGKYEKTAKADWHHGDICISGGRLYAAVNRGKFNQKDGAQNFVYVYDLDLNLLETVPIGFMPQGLGAIEFANGSFYLGGGALKGAKTFRIYKCSPDFKLEETFDIPAHDSELGVQTICFSDGFFWLGCYMSSGREFLWKLDGNMKVLERFNTYAACGIARIPHMGGLAVGETRKGESGLFEIAEIRPVRRK